MSPPTYLRTQIAAKLAAFGDQPLGQAALQLLATLGYASDRTVKLDSVEAEKTINMGATAAGAMGS